jgi:hypothetical protein
VTQRTPNLRARLRVSRGVLVDSNVLLDITTKGSAPGGLVRERTRRSCWHTALIINPIIYAEVSIGYTTIEALDAALPVAIYQRQPLPWEAAFLQQRASRSTAGTGVRGHLSYRISTSARTLPLVMLRCSRAMRDPTAAISQQLKSSPRRSGRCDPIVLEGVPAVVEGYQRRQIRCCRKISAADLAENATNFASVMCALAHRPHRSG